MIREAQDPRNKSQPKDYIIMKETFLLQEMLTQLNFHVPLS